MSFEGREEEMEMCDGVPDQNKTGNTRFSAPDMRNNIKDIKATKVNSEKEVQVSYRS